MSERQDEKSTRDLEFPNTLQREVGTNWLKKFVLNRKKYGLDDDPAFVAAAVYRIMMIARIDPGHPSLDPFRNDEGLM